MKFGVCVTRVPSTTAKIEIDGSGRAIREEGVEFIPNPYDEWYALVRAVELKQSTGGEVIVYTVGPSSWEPIIRKCLALGADRAVRINMEPLDEFTTARELARVLKRDGIEVIMAGKESIDFQGGVVPSLIAGFLEVTFISSVSKMEIKDGTIICEREIPGGVEVVEVTPPVVISATKGLADQKLPSIMAIMQAKKKPLEAVEPENTTPSYYVEKIELVEKKKECKIFTADQIDEFVREVIQEKKIIPL